VGTSTAVRAVTAATAVASVTGVTAVRIEVTAATARAVTVVTVVPHRDVSVSKTGEGVTVVTGDNSDSHESGDSEQ
jgi:hypothetical protein